MFELSMNTKLYAVQYVFRCWLISSAFSFARASLVGKTEEIKMSLTFAFLAFTPSSIKLHAIWSGLWSVAFLPIMSFVPPCSTIPSGLLRSATSAYVIRWLVVAPEWANLSMNARWFVALLRSLMLIYRKLLSPSRLSLYFCWLLGCWFCCGTCWGCCR